MELRRFLGMVSVSAVCGSMALGQPAPDAEELEKSVRQLREEFEERQQAYERQLDALTRQLEALQAQANSTPTSTNDADALSSDPSPAPPASGEPPLAAKPWSPADPLQLVGRGNSYMNISFDALFAAGSSTADDIEGGTQLGAHDPNQRGFTVQNLELTLDGAIDPYFRGLSSLIFQIDSEGESFLELEEAYLETFSLPANLQLRAGQYFTEFGRLNSTHPHAWTFVDQPIINGRLLGPDGMRNPGARLSWLTPTPFYSELFFGVQNSQGETAHSFRSDHEEELSFGRTHDPGSVSSLGDMLFSTRYAVSFELSDTQTLLAGASGAFGPNGSGAHTDTQIFGVDLFWKWRPVNHQGGFPFVSWQTEAMARRYQAGAFAEDADGDGVNETDLPEETLWDYGFYSQIAYGFKRGWVAALRGEYAGSEGGQTNPDPDRDPRWRISPNLTWFPSEFSKIRLQYNYDDRENIGTDHSIWLQFEFLLGAHGAHKF